nr:annexin A3 isoform X1 [Manis javanica]XP_036870764.1 annexin A3 isoform X2 [Manis javanica]
MASIWVGHRGTIQDYPGFSPSADAEAIRKAIRGIGTDEKALISILTERPNAQRQLVVKEYQATYGKDLKDDLKGDLSGHFEHLMVALMTPPAVFDAKQLKKSMKGAGTNEAALIEILTTRTSRQLKEISQAYYTGTSIQRIMYKVLENDSGRVQIASWCQPHPVYKKSLGDDISSETSGDFRKALLTLADGRRDESLKVDEHLAKKDAQILYNAGENRWGTDEDKFTEILCLRSFPQLKLTFDEYRNISQKDIEDSIKGELSGHFEDLLLAIVHCARNMPAFLAERLHQALKGAGTDEFTLNRIMVSRSEIDLLDIRAEFKKHYGYSLYSAIKSDTSGDYEVTLLKICGGDD